VSVKQRAYHVKEFSLMKLKQATPTIKVNTGTILDPEARGEGIRTTTLLAWLFWVLVLVCATASFALKFNSLFLGYENIASGGYLQENIGGEEYLQQVLYQVILVSTLAPAYGTVGAIVASRRPANGVGWLCLALGLFISLQDLTWQYATRALEITPGSLPAGQLMVWLSQVLELTFPLPPPLPSLPLLDMLLLMIFPTGQFLSRGWRLVGWATVGWTCLCRLAILVSPTFPVTIHMQVTNPTGIKGIQAGVDVVKTIIPWLGILVGLGPISSIFARWKRARSKERQQLKWLMYMGILIIASGLLTLASSYLPVSPYIPLIIGAIGVAGVTIGIPGAIGIAMLRHQLYDIDIIINRTLVYGILTVSIAGLYVLVVVSLGTLFQAQGDLVISLFATGLIAVLFQPLRSRLQRGVNRLMYGERDDPYAVLSRLGRRLEATLAPEAVLPIIVETVAQALRLPYAAITLKQGDEFTIAAAYGIVREELVRLPLFYQHEQIGELLLAPRRRGETFSAADRGLLDDLARQAGVAAHAVRLTADLQRSRERLVTTREEERRRLRRDLHDGLGPTLAALNLQAGVVRKLIPQDPTAADALVGEWRTTLRTAIADIRRLVYELRPPALDELGLVGAMRQQAAQYSTHHDMNALQVVVEAPDPMASLPAAVEVAAYRITQEALANVVHHAQAHKCCIRLWVDDALHLEITDDGIGLPTEHRMGMGLLSMRERAAELGGTCVVEPVVAGGTRVYACLPLLKE
jgi:signal transduction histidine kinase